MTWLVSLTEQVRKVLTREHGGTGNKKGWGQAVVVPYLNATADPIEIGSVVRVSVQNRVWLQDDDTATDTLGVVVGRFDVDGETFVEEDPPSFEYAAVMLYGETYVKLDPYGIEASEGDFAVTSSDPGGAAGVSTTPTETVFGRFTGKGDPGDRAKVKLGGGGGR